MFGCIKKEEDMLTFCHSYPAVLAAYLACLTLFVLRSAMIWFIMRLPKSRRAEKNREARIKDKGRKVGSVTPWATLC